MRKQIKHAQHRFGLHWQWWWIGSGILLLLSATAASWLVWRVGDLAALLQLQSHQVQVQVAKITQPTIYYSPLTGMKVASAADTLAQVRGVMIENSPDARPQSGLKQAGVVFEADADGGITRFLVLYQETHPSLIGPVRSVRPYFVDWLTPFDASISHVGGSAKALQTVRNGSYKDLDQFFNSAYYWRASDRYAPHNVYTNSDKLMQLNQTKGYTASHFTGFVRKNDTPPGGTPTVTSITITVSSTWYNVHYDYDQANNAYLRSEGGAPHADREEGRIEPKVAIVMQVPASRVFEDGYRTEMQTIGSGTVYIFQDGGVVQGTWHKASQGEQITFTDSNGKPIALNRGQTWITIITPQRSVLWK